jgi:parvulin-like peptidyl-prolyl isomerase
VVQETGFFARDEPILGVGAAPEMTARAFDMNNGDVSGAIRTGRGYVFETLTDKQDPHDAKLEEVKERVRDEVTRQRAREMAKQKASDLAAKVKNAPDFAKAAKTAGFEAKTTELITRESPLPDLGVAADVLDAAFKLPEGGVSEPIATDTGIAVIKVLEKQEVTATDLTANKDKFREDLLTDRRNRFFSAYMVKAKQKMKIEVNRQAIQRVVG